MSLEREKTRPPRHQAQLSMWRGGLGILDTQLNSVKIKMDSKVVKSHQCSQQRSHAVSIELNSEY